MTLRRAQAALVAALLTLTLPVGLAPTAEAHCNWHGYLPGMDLVDVTTCRYNDEVEEVVEALNDASDRMLVYVLVKDRGFHPPVVHVKTGGTVVLVYADFERKEQHDPRNSNRCANGVDPIQDPEGCDPTPVVGNCFSNVDDLGGVMAAVGDYYQLTFRYTPALGKVEKSKGFLSGTLPVLGSPPFAQPFTTCPNPASYRSPTDAVIPYHCDLHLVEGMRGTIVVDAA